MTDLWEIAINKTDKVLTYIGLNILIRKNAQQTKMINIYHMVYNALEKMELI